VSQTKIIEAINRRLDERGWSQRKLARQTGMNHSTLNRKLKGNSQFAINEAIRICLALELSARDLFGEQAA
jgi:transcriptional regulator with XRE-family HTH domain